MSRQSTRDTAPELAVRRELHRRGLRYRVGYRPEPGIRRVPDITFTRARVVVFIDGCFWHRCPKHGTMPAANGDWWQAKLARNVERDRETDRLFAEHGWRVLRFWEHENSMMVCDRVEQEVEAVRGASESVPGL